MASYQLIYNHYRLIYLDVAQYESAAFIRRTLKHPDLNTKAQRLGRLIRGTHGGLAIWDIHAEEKLQLTW